MDLPVIFSPKSRLLLMHEPIIPWKLKCSIRAKHQTPKEAAMEDVFWWGTASIDNHVSRVFRFDIYLMD